MKVRHRVLSLLLALALLFGLFPTVARPTVVEAAASDTPAGVRNHLPLTAKDVVYLSDMNWEYSINYQDKVAIKNGAWSNGGEIVMGLAKNNGGTVFTKGLGVMPKGTSATDASHTVFDLADNNYAQDFFYAAAGITNGTAQGGGSTNGVVFEVWGSYDKTQEDYSKAEYKLLERSGDPAKGTHVKGNYVYQFHLDITGVRYLKLVVYAVGSVSYMNSNWAGVCVYNNPGYFPKGDLMGLNNGKDNTTWVPSGTDRFNTYHFDSLPADAVLLSGAGYKDAATFKGTAKMVDFKSASGNLGSGSHWLGGVADQLTTTPTPNLKDGIVLKDASKYFRFNARTPANSSNQTDGWVTFDISDLNVDRFYTVIGGGNGTAKHTAYNPSNGTYGGVKCQVWGCTTKDGTYELLSESEPIMLSQTGEFLVDISGYNFLKLRIQAKDTRIINGLDTLFYMPCVFNEWDVVASGAASVMQGTTADYTTTIRHDFTANYNYPGTINWAVTGAEKSGTKITNGKLSVDPSETATELKVTASLTEGGKTVTSKPVTVAVTKAPVYTLDIEGPAEAGKNTEQTITTKVTKDGVADTYDKITWTVTGNTDAATKIENGKLTIGNESVGTKLKIKASLTEYGITREDTIEITIAAYGLSITGDTAMEPAGQLVLNAQILNEGQPVASTVNWSVDGEGTITPAGNQVVVTSKGTVGKIKVTASWTTPGGSEVSATHEISVNAYTMDMECQATAVSKGSTLPLSVIVKKNGEKVDNPTVSWKIVNLTTGVATDKTGTSVNLAINDDAGSVLVITASAEFGGLVISESRTVKVTDYKLTIDPASLEVEQGDTAELKATLTNGTSPIANPAITWNVSKVGGSALNVSGDVLTLTANDPAGTEMTVVASSVVDGETILSAPAKVTVIAPIVYTVTLNKSSASVKQGESVTFSATVKKGDAPVSDPAITWAVTGGTKSGTKIDANGKLTIDKQEPAGTMLSVTATYEVGGKQFTSTAAVVTVIPAPVQDAFTIVTSGYETVPANAIYLADDGVVWTESVNNGGAPAIRNGAWKNGAAIWIGGGATTGGTNFQKGIGVQAQRPTADNNRGASWTTIDISNYNCDTFYAAVGGTNASNQQNGHNSFIYQVYGSTEKNGTFTLLAESTPLTRTTTGEFKVDITGVKYLKLLIKCTETGGEGFGNSVWANAAIYSTAVDSYTVTATASATKVEQGKSVTFAAAVTKGDQPQTGHTITWAVTGATQAGTKIDTTGKLSVDAKEPAGTKLSVTASIDVGGKGYSSAPVTVTVTEAISDSFQKDAFKENTTGKYTTLASNVTYLSDVEWIESVNNEGLEAIRNGAWKGGAPIYIGGTDKTGGVNFPKGIGVQAQRPTADNNRGASWTTIDISNYNCDTFYAAVGGTNASNQQNGHNSFIYQVYGAAEKNGEFILLAQSAPLTKTQTGEFNVNIKGMKVLKLVIKCTETGSEGFGNSVWANAAIYKATADSYTITATAPVTSVEQGKSATFTASVTKNGKPLTTQAITWAVTGATKTGTKIDSKGKLTVDAKESAGTNLSVTASITVSGNTYTSIPVVITVDEKISESYQKDAFKENTTGKYATLASNVTYLSDVDWVESVNLGGVEAIRNGLWQNGAPIYIGGTDKTGGVNFPKGIGVQAQRPTADNNRGASWTTIDISKYGCDTFYAAVGGTNASNHQNGHNSFIYQVYGAAEKNGEFILLAQSAPLTKTQTGEFNVNIKGMKVLKLVIKCTETGSEGFGNSMWANAAIYDSTADSYTITATGSADSVQQGKSATFTASVTKNGKPLTGQTITWAVTGGSQSGTKIDAKGKLTVDKKEAVGTKLSVTASIKVDGETYTSTAVEITVDEAVSEYYQKDAFKENTTGEYKTLASNVTYLSDVDWMESVNLGGAEAIRNGLWQNGAPIYIGGTATTGGVNFPKGIGVQAQAPTADNNRGASWTTIDISKYGCDTFYAAVGGTNAANQENGHNSFIYQVYGATEKNGEFLLLAQTAPLTKTQTGEFNVNIKGMKVLKLVIKCAETGNHGFGNSVWANAAIYDSTADSYTISVTAPATSVQQSQSIKFTAEVTKNGKALKGQSLIWAVTGGTQSGTKIDDKGKLTVDMKESAGTKLSVTASIKVGKHTYTSTAVEITVDEYISKLYQPDAFKVNTTNKYQKLAKNVIWLSDVKWVESVNHEKKEAIRNGVWQNGAAIYIGGKSNNDVTDGTKFEKGIGVQAQAPTADNNRGASWTTINVENLKCDTFYAAIGGTNAANQEFGHNSFVYQVFGTTEKDGDFVLLAESKPMTKTETGEFKLDIKGIVLLKLVIKCAETGNHGYGNSVWANACVYNKDGSNGNLSAMTESSSTVTETPKQKKAFAMNKGVYLTPVGKVTFISDMEWVESVNLGGVEAIRNGAWQNGAPIWLGGSSAEKGGTKFVKGIGVQAQAPTADNNRGASWTTVDITGMNCNTFYAIVGATNASNQENGHNSFIYQVYGAQKENGKYTLLAQSKALSKKETGEFKVDITGYNFLKLVIKCAETGNHGYGNSAWANACIFNSAEAQLVESTEDAVTGPTAPTVTKPKPTAPVDEAEPDGMNIGMVAILAAAVAVLAIIAVVVILIIKKKRKG